MLWTTVWKIPFRSLVFFRRFQQLVLARQVLWTDPHQIAFVADLRPAKNRANDKECRAREERLERQGVLKPHKRETSIAREQCHHGERNGRQHQTALNIQTSPAGFTFAMA